MGSNSYLPLPWRGTNLLFQGSGYFRTPILLSQKMICVCGKHRSKQMMASERLDTMYVHMYHMYQFWSTQADQCYHQSIALVTSAWEHHGNDTF
jgi:hypothetical protein